MPTSPVPSDDEGFPRACKKDSLGASVSEDNEGSKTAGAGASAGAGEGSKKAGADSASALSPKPTKSLVSEGGRSFVERMLLECRRDPKLAVKKWIAGLNVQSKTSEKIDVGANAPIRGYEFLIWFPSFAAIVDEMERCTSKDELDQVKEKWAKHKQAYADLINSTRSAKKRFSTTLENHMNPDKKSKKASVVKARSAASASRSAGALPKEKSTPVQDGTDESLCQVPRVKVETADGAFKPLEELGVAFPVFLSIDCKDAEAKLPNLVLQAEHLKKAFAKSAERESKKRKNQRMTEDAIKD